MPTYGEARKALLELWKEKYEAKLGPKNVIENPEGKGILCSKRNKKQKKSLCYYHFKIHLARLYRKKKEAGEKGRWEEGEELIAKEGREVEAWLRCRRNVSLAGLCQWELYFLRRDLLPLAGKKKYWHKK